jgi:hypothetical protein
MARDNSPKIRQQAQLIRKLNKRASYDRILIVSEGSKTEPLYFKEICAAYRLNTANVEVQPSALGTEPLQVVQYARDLFEKGDSYKNIRKRAFEQVYAVFDRDDHKTYYQALEKSKSLDGKLKSDQNEPVIFRAVTSIPSFELWLLLHFEDIHHWLHRDEVMIRLKKHISDYKKGSDECFKKTRNTLDIACERARRLATLSTAYDDTKPHTAVFELVDLLVNPSSSKNNI